MADPITKTADGLGLALGTLSAALGVPILTAITAAVGAAYSVSTAGRIEWSVKGVWLVILTFTLAFMLAIFAAQIGVPLVVVLLPAKTAAAIPAKALGAGLALIVSALSHSAILPALNKAIGVKIDKIGGQL